MEAKKNKTTNINNESLATKKLNEVQHEKSNQSSAATEINEHVNCKLPTRSTKSLRKTSAYSIFRTEELARLKNQVKNLSGREILKIVGKNWSEIKDDPKSKIYYERAEEENKKRIESKVIEPKIKQFKKRLSQPMILSKYFHLFIGSGKKTKLEKIESEGSDNLEP
jgi:hypothetical protein